MESFLGCLLHFLSSLTEIKIPSKSFPEPIGFKAPAFGNDVKSISITREENIPFELSCRAQGYPSPSFRYFYFLKSSRFCHHHSFLRWLRWLFNNSSIPSLINSLKSPSDLSPRKFLADVFKKLKWKKIIHFRFYVWVNRFPCHRLGKFKESSGCASNFFAFSNPLPSDKTWNHSFSHRTRRISSAKTHRRPTSRVDCCWQWNFFHSVLGSVVPSSFIQVKERWTYPLNCPGCPLRLHWLIFMELK